jgi:short-chain fatty acids transporter
MTVIARLGSALNRWSRRWVPDPFVLALFLTLVVMLLGLWRAAVEPRSGASGPLWTVMKGWIGSDGMMSPGGLAFALQMCLILVTGHALALSPAVQRFIRWVANRPGSAASATMLVALVSCAAAVIHWGLGAIAGALLAREIGRHAATRGLSLHYPLLGAAGYAGFAVWHGGLTGSAPTLVAKNDHFAADLIGTVPMSQTVFSPLNLVITGALIVLIVVLFRVLVPRDPGDFVAADPSRLAPLPDRDGRGGEVQSPVHWLQESWMVGALLGTLGFLFVVGSMIGGELAWTLDTVVLLFLFLSMALQGSLRHYVEAIADGARGAAGIVLQFPFYFGILGIMKATAMVEWISNGLVELSSRATFPVVAFISAGVVNLFVPSGGGQWAVQGDILLDAGNELGVDPSVTIMAFSYGDAWTNMLQPFWALPLLGIMGLRARDIIGYTTVVFLMMAVVVPSLLMALG